jgi:DNA-binding Xre family transcriptional regulator
MHLEAILNPHGTISRALAEIRADGGPDLDLCGLSEEAKVPRERLVQLDTGRLSALDLAELERLCRILGRSPNDLLGYEPDM